MPSARVIKGRLIGPKSVELDEAVSNVESNVEVIVRPGEPAAGNGNQSISELIQSLPPGTRTKEEIDLQIQEERQGWGDR